jgi:hypothetical protein
LAYWETPLAPRSASFKTKRTRISWCIASPKDCWLEWYEWLDQGITIYQQLPQCSPTRWLLLGC